MFDEQNYIGCINKINLNKNTNETFYSNLMQKQEANFLLLASNYYQNILDNTINELKAFLKIYPQTSHKNEIYFMIASSFFKRKNYEEAEIWFNKCDIDLLPINEQKDYIYRMGIILLQKENYEAATYFFSVLHYQDKNKYKNLSKYYLAYIAYKKEQYNYALKYFLQLKNHPTLGYDALYYAINICFIQKKYLKVRYLGEAILKKYTNPTCTIYIKKLVGIAYYYENNYLEVIHYLKPIKTKSVQENIILGLSYFQLKDYKKTINYLTKNYPSNNILGQNIYLYLGQAYLLMGNHEKALLSFKNASEMNFNVTAKEIATYNYAMLSYQIYQTSTTNLEEVINIMKNFINTYPKSIYYDKINNILINIYLITQNYEAALASIDKVKSFNKTLLEIKQKLYYYLGCVAFNKNYYNLAIENFNYAIAIENYALKEKKLALYLRGESQYQKKNYTLAEKDFQSYAKINNEPNDLNTIIDYNLGYCAFKLAKYSKAEKFFESFVNNEKSNKLILFDAYNRLGDCYFINRKLNNSEKAYNKAIEISPLTSDYALFHKGCVLGLQKKYQEKIIQMDNLIKNFPKSSYIVNAIYEKGCSYILLNKRTEAIKAYQSLLYQYPEKKLARTAGLQLGLLYYNDNQFQKAISTYKYIVSNYPESAEAKQALQDLQSTYSNINDIDSYIEFTKSLKDKNLVKPENSKQDSILYLTAERFLVKGETQKAQNALNYYLQTFPTGSFCNNTHYYLAKIYYEQKKYDLAKKEYNKILNMENTQFTEEITEKMAEIEYNNKKYEISLQLYKKLKNIAENKTNKNKGILGIIRSLAQLNNYRDILPYINFFLVNNDLLTSEIATEIKFYRIKSYLALGKTEQAELDLKDLSINTQTVYSSEAHYLLAKYYFDKGNIKNSQNIIQNYIKQRTRHSYWIAKSIILLSDIYLLKKDTLQSRQYLESLKTNYKNNNDDIHSAIKERLNKF